MSRLSYQSRPLFSFNVRVSIDLSLLVPLLTLRHIAQPSMTLPGSLRHIQPLRPWVPSLGVWGVGAGTAALLVSLGIPPALNVEFEIVRRRVHPVLVSHPTREEGIARKSAHRTLRPRIFARAFSP